ncbi:unnamed protein product [Owenia fusiformis]|uniref:Apple domain-containing protein n=1 Tax=Owenia fusiformis TaxID=6347 RepID=A0A8S4PHI3_OWEFU|nr:unnamed protein product [Owenia fusiformis]
MYLYGRIEIHTQSEDKLDKYNTNEGTHNDINDGSPDNTNDGTPENTKGDSLDDTNDGSPDNTNDGSPDNTNDASPDNTNDGSPDNTNDGSPDDTNDGSPDNTNDGALDNTNDGSPDNTNDGSPDNTNDGALDNTNDGSPDNTNDGSPYNTNDGTPHKSNDGSPDNTNDGASNNNHDGKPNNEHVDINTEWLIDGIPNGGFGHPNVDRIIPDEYSVPTRGSFQMQEPNGVGEIHVHVTSRGIYEPRQPMVETLSEDLRFEIIDMDEHSYPLAQGTSDPRKKCAQTHHRCQPQKQGCYYVRSSGVKVRSKPSFCPEAWTWGNGNILKLWSFVSRYSNSMADDNTVTEVMHPNSGVHFIRIDFGDDLDEQERWVSSGCLEKVSHESCTATERCTYSDGNFQEGAQRGVMYGKHLLDALESGKIATNDETGDGPYRYCIQQIDDKDSIPVFETRFDADAYNRHESWRTILLNDFGDCVLSGDISSMDPSRIYPIKFTKALWCDLLMQSGKTSKFVFDDSRMCIDDMTRYSIVASDVLSREKCEEFCISMSAKKTISRERYVAYEYTPKTGECEIYRSYLVDTENTVQCGERRHYRLEYVSP